MRLAQYLKEDKIKAADLKNALRSAARRVGIDPKKLIYIGFEDYDLKDWVERMYYFNVDDPSHKKHQSTIVHTEKLK